jgi:hypothetical protein
MVRSNWWSKAVHFLAKEQREWERKEPGIKHTL